MKRLDKADKERRKRNGNEICTKEKKQGIKWRGGKKK